MTKRLTKRIVDEASTMAPVAFLWDAEVRGFGVCLRASGTKTYIVQYRTAAGRSRRMKLGQQGTLTLDEARKAAKLCLAAVLKGRDPAAERSDRRSSGMMGELLDLYVERHVRVHNAPKTQKSVCDLVDTCIRPALGHRVIVEISRNDMMSFHQKLRSTPRKANLALAVLSKAFALAEQWQLRPEHSNPCRGVARFPEQHRERFLSLEELKRLGQALELAATTGLPWRSSSTTAISKHLAKPANQRTLIDPTVIAVIRALLLSGARLSEMLELKQAHINLTEGLIHLPASKGRDRKPYPLSDALGELLTEQVARHTSPWVFPRTRDASRHVAMEVVENAWQRLRQHAGLDDVRLRDLRHTVGTHAAASGANAFAIRDLLRHAGVAMTSRYVNRYDVPMRQVANGAATTLAEALGAAAKR
jgi:integrase